MSDPMPMDNLEKPKRFYQSAAAGPLDDGFGALLDGRPVRSPAGLRLVTPTLALASLIAEEWAAQGKLIDIGRMPATRLAFTTLDRVVDKRAETVAEIVRYAGTDLLCYRADGPAALIEREARAWEPVLDWARAELRLDFTPTSGIVHRAQSGVTLRRVGDLAEVLDDFALAGLAFATALYGSAVLALAVQRERLGGEEAFDLSRLDESFQQEKWGVDAEAAERTAHHRREALMIGGWFQALA
jgi:chaperone required for assembly of F1-ATPase